MSEKLSQNILLQASAQLYMKYVPIVQCERLDFTKSVDRDKFIQILVRDFANFQKALYDQLQAELESGK